MVAAQLAAAGKRLLLMDQPWNRGVPESDLVSRCMNWLDVLLKLAEVVRPPGSRGPGNHFASASKDLWLQACQRDEAKRPLFDDSAVESLTVAGETAFRPRYGWHATRNASLKPGDVIEPASPANFMTGPLRTFFWDVGEPLALSVAMGYAQTRRRKDHWGGTVPLAPSVYLVSIAGTVEKDPQPARSSHDRWPRDSSAEGVAGERSDPRTERRRIPSL